MFVVTKEVQQFTKVEWYVYVEGTNNGISVINLWYGRRVQEHPFIVAPQDLVTDIEPW